MTLHYITIGEQFNMTSLACMPESFTGIYHITSLPSSDNSPFVTVNDAYVTFIGSELHNTTLFMGDGKNFCNLFLSCVIISVFLFYRSFQI